MQETSSSDKTSISKEELVFEEIGRCLIHMQEDIFSSSRSEVLHARMLEMMSKEVTEHTPSIALSMRSNGFILMINPHFFLEVLQNTSERCASLRHAEQHLFLMHPMRQYRWLHNHFDASVQDLRLFQICADLEASDFISGYCDLDHQVKRVPQLAIPQAASAEALYDLLAPTWHALHQDQQEHHQEQQELSENKELAKYLKQWSASTCPCDQTQWVQPHLSSVHILILQKALDRLLIQVRESLSVKELDELSDTAEMQTVERSYQRQHIQATPPKCFSEASQEVERVIVRMSLKDPFFSQFISGLVRQVSDQVPTAGVGFDQDHLTLYINPDFFMNQLKDLAERAAVLKHEALHIILKHVFQMRLPQIKDKRVYNIAADLEVNQYIGHPWSLPKSAIVLSKFESLNLPKNDIAENYYKLLIQQKNHKSIDQVLEQKLNDGHGHSDHRGWESADQKALSSGDQNEAIPNLTDLPETLNPINVDAHEYEVEKKVQQAISQLSGKDRGKIPGSILKIVDEWIKKRQAQVDWKRVLRLFVHTNLSSERKRSVRRKNKRYTRQFRLVLHSSHLTADVLQILARNECPTLPKIPLQSLTDQHIDYIRTIYPKWNASHMEDRSSEGKSPAHQYIDWKRIPLLAFHHIYQDFKNQYTWPTWNDVSDRILTHLKLMRTPLDPRVLPTDIWGTLAKEYPTLLPEFTWDLVPLHEMNIIKKRDPLLFQFDTLVWKLIPLELLIKIIQWNPQLFTLTWNDLPKSFMLRSSQYQLESAQPFRIDRLVKKQLPGSKKKKLHPKILIMVDTSASVSDYEIELLFAEIDKLYQLKVEVHILQVDTKVQLYYPYSGTKPIAGRGGTEFDPSIKWLNQARFGVDTPILDSNGKRVNQKVTLKVDGAIYLTDGYASTPTIAPYCRLMFVLTPDGTDENIKDWAYASKVITLPKNPVEEN